MVTLVESESLILALIGSAIGVGLSFAVTATLESLPQLNGVLHSNFTAGAFWRGLVVGLGTAILGSLYPAVRAANLTLVKALSNE